jgi:hypothetical protein
MRLGEEGPLQIRTVRHGNAQVDIVMMEAGSSDPAIVSGA